MRVRVGDKVAIGGVRDAKAEKQRKGMGRRTRENSETLPFDSLREDGAGGFCIICGIVRKCFTKWLLREGTIFKS